jgi:hypothetical protein
LLTPPAPRSLDNQVFENPLIEKQTRADSLPRVLNKGQADLIAANLRHQAVLKFATHQLPSLPEEWKKERVKIKNDIIRKAGIIIDHKLPLNYQETGVSKMEGFTIKARCLRNCQLVCARRKRPFSRNRKRAWTLA